MKSRPIALCGLLTALAAVCLMLGGILPGATFCAPLLAILVLLPILEEYGPRYAAAAWIAVSILGLLLAADRELAFLYLFFGWYPILRPRIAAWRHPAARVLCRLGLCTGLSLLLYGLVLRLLGLDAAADLPAARAASLALLALGNVVFLLADRMLDRMTLLWHQRLRRRFFH